MNEDMAKNTLAQHIDSFQKLQFLLFLNKHPNMKGTCEEFGERLYFGHTPLMEEILNELLSIGLIEQIENCYQLSHAPEVLLCLQHLARTFENPLSRQQILNQMRPKALFSR